ncbi:MAG: hypothetical protein WKF59_10305 [Chitinophagaceae bacterium]
MEQEILNKPIIEAINNTLRTGKNIDWRQMWNNLEVVFAKAALRDKKDLFDDYIPPHKNSVHYFLKLRQRQDCITSD